MAYQATVCNVMIASPGDVQAERNLIRDVVHEWNAVHASARKFVLMPVGWETHSTPLMGDRPQSIINWQVLKDSDLLIAVFWTRLGSSTGKAPSGTVEEIEEHIVAGKPALTYFSSAPVKLDSVDPIQYEALRKFKEECKGRGLYESYETTSEFQGKVRNQMSMTMNNHPYFREINKAAVDGENYYGTPPQPEASRLSQEARQLLLEATADDGEILVVATSMGTTVQANNKALNEPMNPRSVATWRGAVQELLSADLVEEVGYEGHIFRVTGIGYSLADQLKQ